MSISKISELEREAMKKKSAQSLPDVPSAHNLTPKDFKNAITRVLFDTKNSFYDFFNRLSDEIVEELTKKLDISSEKIHLINDREFTTNEEFSSYCRELSIELSNKIFYGTISTYKAIGIIDSNNNILICKSNGNITYYNSSNVESGIILPSIITNSIENNGLIRTGSLNVANGASIIGNSIFVGLVNLLDSTVNVSTPTQDNNASNKKYVDTNINLIKTRVVSLENFKDTKGKADGIAPLDENKKIPLTYLYDDILGQLLYKGTCSAEKSIISDNISYSKITSFSNKDSNDVVYQFVSKETVVNALNGYGSYNIVCLLAGNIEDITYLDSNNNQLSYRDVVGKFALYSNKIVYIAQAGDYFIVNNSNTQSDLGFENLELEIGDWVVSNGDESFVKIDNTDAVTMVAGLKGNISVSSLKNALGIDKVDNTTDSEKSVLQAQKDANGNKIDETYATKNELNEAIGTINSILDNINGEVI